MLHNIRMLTLPIFINDAFPGTPSQRLLAIFSKLIILLFDTPSSLENSAFRSCMERTVDM